METLNALQAVKNVKERLVDYCLEEHFVKDPDLGRACRSIWEGPPEDGGLVGDLWVEGTFPNLTCGQSLAQRVAQGTFDHRLTDLIDVNKGFDKDWTPRSIQSESLDLAGDGYQSQHKPAIVVTAGTGAGKTEAFLLPMLNELFRNPAQQGRGVSAIVLYPMNALVKDQVDRIHSWLHGQRHVRMFSFTGATPERYGRPYYGDGSRFSSRNEARGLGSFDNAGQFTTGLVPGYRPPEILVTNYSMLEYMLARPQDQVFFGANLRTIVLDEAHLYRGNLAADIALLLRRIYLRSGVRSDDVLQFATSATIGREGVEGVTQLREFAGKLFSKSTDRIKIVQGNVAEESAFSGHASDHTFDCKTLHAQIPPDEATLTGDEPPAFANSVQWDEWKAYCRILFGDHETEAAFKGDNAQHVAPVLHHMVPRSPVFQKLYHALFQNGCPRRMKLRDLAQKVLEGIGDVEVECVRRMLAIGAIARPEPWGMPLIPNRVHTLFRAPEGLAFRFDPHSGNENTRIHGLGHVFSISRKPSQDDAGNPVASLSLCRCQDSGEWFFAGLEDDQECLKEVSAFRMYQDSLWESEGDAADDETIGDRLRFFKTCNSTEALVWMNSQNGQISAVQQDCFIPLKEFVDCPTSGVPLIKRARFFISPSRLTLSIIAESLLAEMPPMPGAVAGRRPGGGRRLIAFSDSRKEAARMGPTLQAQHEQQILRAVIARVFTEDAPRQLAKLRDLLAALQAGLNPGGVLDEVINTTTQGISRLESGLSLDDLVTSIGQREELRQLIDDLARQNHREDSADSDWQNNQEAIGDTEFLRKRVSVELARRASWPSLTVETTGLIEVIYPGIEGLAMPDSMGAVGTHNGRELLRPHWPTFLQLLCDEIRNRSAITVGHQGTDWDNHLGKWVRYMGDGQAVGLVPTRDHANTRMGRFLLAVCAEIGWGEGWAVAGSTASTILQIAFEQLAGAPLAWIASDPNVPGNIRLIFRELRFRIPLNYYQCAITGQVWGRSLFGLAPSRSRIQLRAISPDHLDCDPLVGRRRTELRNTGPDDVFRVGLWAEEHSAQLDIVENERIQNLFKSGMRNILSSTTTLELGIDIGGLSGVIMGNIPPGKANYLQRAGRAGRRADGSSLVCSFARSSPYERKAFLSFDEYIGRELPSPTIHLDREKIVRRHLHMYLLSEFMRLQNAGEALPGGAMQAFGKMGMFTGRTVPDYWIPIDQRDVWDIWNHRQLPNNSIATGFLDYLEDAGNDAISNDVLTLCGEIPDLESRWQVVIQEARTIFREIMDKWCGRFNDLGEFWNAQGTNEQAMRACGAVRKEGVAMVNDQVIEVLGNGLFIPRYGFPIDVMKLHDLNKPDQNGGEEGNESRRFKLERDCTMAIREYAPGEQILAGGFRLTSRGILKHWTGVNVNNDHNAMLQRGRWVTNATNGFRYDDGFNGNPNPQNQFKSLLFPKHGFTTANWEKPERAYRLKSVRGALVKTDAFNDRSPDDARVEIHPDLVGWRKEGGSLYALHQGENKLGFAVCLDCGYTQCEESAGRTPTDLPKGFSIHKAIFSSFPGARCWTEVGLGATLRHQVLAARQVTNFLMIDFSNRVASAEVAFTLAQALRLAGAELLHLDYREIRALDPVSGFVKPSGMAAVLYDTLAGGSGHVEELAKMGEDWLRAAVKLLTIEEAATDEWRKREAIQRLLTTDIREFDLTDFKPLEALQVLNDILDGVVPGSQQPESVIGIANRDIWSIARFGNSQPVGPFFFREDGGQHARQMKSAVPGYPSNCTFCIVNSPDGIYDCGRWSLREMRAGVGSTLKKVFRLIGSKTMNDPVIGITPSQLPQVFAVEVPAIPQP